MPSNIPEELTIILNAAAKGDEAAADRVWCTIHADLRQVATATLGTPKIGERHVPGPTTVVEQAFLSLHRAGAADGQDRWSDRKTFFVSIAKEMVRFLIEYRRKNPRLARGGFARVLPLGLDFDAISSFDAALLATDAGVFESLDRLEREAPQRSDVVWLRYVCGLTIDQTAELLGVSSRTVCKNWNAARAWIRRDLDTSLGRVLPEAG